MANQRTISLNEILDTCKAVKSRNAFPDSKLYLEHVEALLVAINQWPAEAAEAVLPD